MKEVLLTSSALILALLVLRLVFRRRISRRVQYALWLLVLVRLLVPVSLPGTPVSLLTAAEPVVQRLETERPLTLSPVRETVTEPEGGALSHSAPASDLPADQSAPDSAPASADGSGGVRQADPPRQVDLDDLLRWVWYAGMAAMAVWLLISTLRFRHKLRKARIPYSVEGCKYPVYLVEEGLPSPCLFGLIRPAVYLTPAAAAPERLRHVLAHESAHARHRDPLWALLRGVCLTVYWFDPLVWLAAAASKADGELACDESALAALGPGERVPYGQTLLALIPVRTGPGDPLLSATTMTAGKRQLKDRIAGIAENRQTRAAALFLVLALAAAVCAVTFTGGVDTDRSGARPLTGDELAYFNEEYFNQDGGACLPNEFLGFLFDAPENVDVFALFCSGLGMTDQVTAEEWQQLEALKGERSELFWGCRKITAADMDAVLQACTGLTAADMDPETLESFLYLPEHDAYYLFYALNDEPSWNLVQFTAGEREGDTVRLYYQAFNFGGYGTRCVTLTEQTDGTWRFVSHLFSDRPAIATVYPEGDPVLAISLAELEPLDLSPLPVTRRTGDRTEEYLLTDVYDDRYILYRSTDGALYAAVENEITADETGIVTWDVGCFFTFPEGTALEDVTVTSYFDLFGRSGIVFSYEDKTAPGSSGTVCDYYYLDGQGQPVRLARAYGTAAAIDLDGDGADELCAASSTTAQIFFRRDEQIYMADVGALLDAAWPEAEYRTFSRWDLSRRDLYLSGQVPVADNGQTGTADRWLYFDGERLLLYRDGTTYTDHLADGIDAPEEVLERMRAYVLGLYEDPEEGSRLVDGDFVPSPVVYDDWRISSVAGPVYEDVGDLRVEIWRMDYQLHTTTPESVVLAGGRYMTEDGWLSAGYPDCDYFYFLPDGDGGRTYLFHMMENDCAPGTELFRSDLIYALSEMEVLALEDLSGQTLLELMGVQPAYFLERLARRSVYDQGAALAALARAAAEEAERFEACTAFMDSYIRDGRELSEAAERAWSVLCAAADSWTAAGSRTLTDARLGLTLRIPAGWDALAEVYTGGSDLPIPLFSLCERTARNSALGTGLVWSLTACVWEDFSRAWPEADGSEVLLASSYVIGSDENYVYLLTTPTDVQFLEDDLYSFVAYETLRAQSQQVLEDFLVRNDIAPNPLCPDTGGCYRYTGSLIVTPEKPPEKTDTAPDTLPTDADIRAALLADYRQASPPRETEDALVYQTEAHRVLAQERSGDTCTFYLSTWRGTFTLTDGQYEFTSGNRIPTALTYTWTGSAWRLTVYWIPGDGEAYAADLRTKFPEEAAEQELDADTVSAIAQELQEACWQDAARYFTEATGSVPQRRFSPSEVEFTGRALEAHADEMTYAERLAWAEDTGLPGSVALVSTGTYLEGGDCLAVLSQWVGTSHTDQYVLSLRFADGTLADLPLPRSSEVNTAKPDTMAFTGGTFVYTVDFSELAATNEGQTLLHLAGTYRYEVDLAARTVSLTVLEG